jgi:hypothetical protein
VLPVEGLEGPAVAHRFTVPSGIFSDSPHRVGAL